MPLDHVANELAKLAGFDGVEFDGNRTETFGPGVVAFRWPCRKAPFRGLIFVNRNSLKVDFRIRRHLPECLLDLLAGIHWLDGLGWPFHKFLFTSGAIRFSFERTME